MNAHQEVSAFRRMLAVDVSSHIEKKNGLSYLSWAWAVAELQKADPAASWSYGEPVKWNDTVMVFCTVTAFSKSLTAQLPVMDHRNKAISNPDAFAVNTAMQRCLAKAIALHGLGLSIYAGEDIPAEDVDIEAEDATTLAKYREAAMNGMDALKAFHVSFPDSASKERVYKEHGKSLAAAAKKADSEKVPA